MLWGRKEVRSKENTHRENEIHANGHYLQHRVGEKYRTGLTGVILLTCTEEES